VYLRGIYGRDDEVDEVGVADGEVRVVVEGEAEDANEM
jgi:hypothetical protein